jgi:hypothetical protein
MARSSPTSPNGSTSSSRRTIIRNTESVRGLTPLISARATSLGCPSYTLARISSDLRKMATQHCALRSGRPIARRLATSGSFRGGGEVISGCANLTVSARRHATWVEICCAITMRTRPQRGSSVGWLGHRSICCDICAMNGNARKEELRRVHRNVFVEWKGNVCVG